MYEKLRNFFGRTVRRHGEPSPWDGVTAQLDSLKHNAGVSTDLLDRLGQNISYQYIDTIIAQNEKYRDSRCVSGAYGQVFSQNNEDGIISEIFRRIGVDTKAFIEIAAGDGIENTTRLLLETGWKGIWVESGAREVDSISHAAKSHIESGALLVLPEHISLENIEDKLISKIDFVPDYISVDIDYNTSHVWRRLTSLRPRLFCVEYNSHYPPSLAYEVPYSKHESWQGSTKFGASLKALEIIGRENGYSLVGCDIFGVNAFFVRDDLCNAEVFLPPFTAENHYEPPRFSAVRMSGHRRSL